MFSFGVEIDYLLNRTLVISVVLVAVPLKLGERGRGLKLLLPVSSFSFSLISWDDFFLSSTALLGALHHTQARLLSFFRSLALYTSSNHQIQDETSQRGKFSSCDGRSSSQFSCFLQGLQILSNHLSSEQPCIIQVSILEKFIYAGLCGFLGCSYPQNQSLHGEELES